MSAARNLGLFTLLAVVWGASFVVIKAGLAYFPPVLFAAVRYDLAAVCTLAYAAWATDNWRPRSRADWTAVAVDGLLIIAAYNALLFVGETRTTGAVAAILIATNPIWATTFSRALLPDERLSAVGVLGLLIGFVGVGMVARPDPSNLLGADFLARLLVLGAAFSVALGSVAVQRVDDDLSEAGTTAWACLLGAVVLHLASAGLSDSLATVDWTVEAVAALVYLGVVASGLGYLIYFTLLTELGPIEINLISYAATVPATVTGWLLLDEVVGPVTLAGLATVFLGFALLKREALREELATLRRRTARG